MVTSGVMEDMKLLLEWYGVSNLGLKIEKIRRYMDELKEKRRWAATVSKTCAVEPGKAIMETIGILAGISMKEETTIADIGSGAGILGVVMAIICDRWNVSMVEVSTRKSAFLAEVIGAIELTNAEVINETAERLAGEREFDLVVSRAVGSISHVAPIALGLLPGDGKYMALKGLDTRDEVEEAAGSLLGKGRVIDIVRPEYPPGLEKYSRISLVVIEKM